MKKLITFLFAILVIYDIYPQKDQKVIIFSKTEGYRHKSIEAGIKSIQELGKENHFNVIASEDSKTLISQLKDCDAVIFLSTSGDILDDDQQEEFKKFIENGVGFIGIHGASATEKNWVWYGKMLGAVFTDHPEIQYATLEVTDQNHPATSFLEKEWQWYDEWYNFIFTDPKISVLLNVDETSYTGGKNGSYHPVAWYKKFGKSKIFYTALGHTHESFSNKNFLKHLKGGILYVLEKD